MILDVLSRIHAFLLKVQWEMMEQNVLPFAQLNADKMI